MPTSHLFKVTLADEQVAIIRHTAILTRIIKIKTLIESKGFAEVDGG
jgi:hypothetical protein